MMNTFWKSAAGKVAALVSTYLIVQAVTITVHAQNLQLEENWWITDGRVNAVAKYNNTVYLGGDFHLVGPSVPFGTKLSPVSGFPDMNCVRPNATVYTSVPDGAGGWYIGGAFTMVGGQTRNRIARINSDGTLHPWNPSADNIVRAIAVSGNTVYVGGNFFGVGGQARTLLAALDATTGLATSWNPGVASTGVVNAIVVNNNTVFVGGFFIYAGGKYRNSLVAIDKITGLATNWNAKVSTNARIYCLALNGNSLYVGGSFGGIGGQQRKCLASLDVTTALANNWNPNLNTNLNNVYIQSFALSGNLIYVAGSGFAVIGGQTRNGLAALDTNTGLASNWNADINGYASVSSVAISGNTVYFGGKFNSVGGQERNNIASVNITNGAVTNWNPNAFTWTAAGANFPDEFYINALAFSGTLLYAGGTFNSIGGQVRDYITALDATTGQVTSWNPGAGYPINALVVGNNTLYVGGNFTRIGGQPRNCLAAFDAVTGQLSNWNPNPSGQVRALAFDGNTIYAGGDFGQIGTKSRGFIAAIDAATGLATNWNPSLAPHLPVLNNITGVHTIVVSGSTVYTGGYFTKGANSINNIAAIDASTGAVSNWNPNANNVVRSLALKGGIIYAGGDFTSIGGQTRNKVAALDATTGLATGWNPDANDYVRSVATIGNTVLVGGHFTTIGGQARNRFAALDITTGLATSWDSGLHGSYITNISEIGNKVYVCGTFRDFNFAYNSYFAVFGTSSLTSGNITGPICSGTTFNIPFSSSISHTSVNVFTAQLSDSSGSFSSPVIIGTLAGPASGTISATLPATVIGTGYRIRVVSSAPAFTGSDNGADLSILAAPSVVNTTHAFFCNGTAGSATLTASGGGSNVTAYRWYPTLTGGTPLHTGASFITPVLTSTRAYYVAAVNASGCESPSRKGAAVYITPAFSVSATAAATTLSVGGSTLLTAAATLGSMAYKWSPATGLNVTTGDSVIATPALTTTYTLTGTRATCTSVTTVTVTVTCPGPLSGTYTINQTLPASATNFPSFKSFADRISLCGVTGPVTVNAAPGTGPYREQVEFRQVPGASAGNTITLNGNGNELQFSPPAEANYLLRFDGTDHFRLQDLTLTSTSVARGWGIHLYNSAEHNLISGCRVNVSPTSTAIGSNGIVASASPASPNVAGATVTDLQLLNNTISGGYYGISLCGPATDKAAGIVLRGNTVTDAWFAGAYLFNLEAVEVEANTLTMRQAVAEPMLRTAGYSSYGLFLNAVDKGFGVRKNKVTGFSRAGLYLNNCNQAGTVRGELSNNMLGGGMRATAAPAYGLSLTNSDRLEVWHNSVNLDKGVAGSAGFYATASSTGLEVRNNSFAYTGPEAGYAFYASPGSLDALDHNNYYATGISFVYLSGDQADISALKAAAGPAGHDQHSWQGEPGYVSATDLHVQAGSTQLARRGAMIAAVATDLDGNPRFGTPDIGADEYAGPARLSGSAEGEVEVSPNPFTTELRVKPGSASGEPVQLRLTDVLGRVVQEHSTAAASHSLNTAELKPGLYLLEIRRRQESQFLRVLKAQ